MYTEKSTELKNDFYTRFGEAEGKLYFARTGIPCVLLKSDTKMLAFSGTAGVRAYGRKYGDVLKLLDNTQNTCDVHFVKNGSGAQILYSRDLRDMHAADGTLDYTIEKLMTKMGISRSISMASSLEAICDRVGSDGWCAYSGDDGISSLPLPLSRYNVMIIRTKKNKCVNNDAVKIHLFNIGENERIKSAAKALRDCNVETLFNMINESQSELARLEIVSGNTLETAAAAREASGVCAVRASNLGVMCICDKNYTDVAAHDIKEHFKHFSGISVGIIIIK